MSVTPIRLGPLTIQLPIRLTTAVPNLSALTFTASALAYDGAVKNDINPPLDTTATYYVILLPLGEDVSNGGLTYSAASPVSGPITVASGEGIRINIANANFPANLNKAYAMAVYLRKNTSDYALQGYYVIPRDGTDFNAMVLFEPLPSNTRYPIGTLNTATESTTYPELGDRSPLGCDFATALKTSGGVQYQPLFTSVPISPDDSTDSTRALGRGYRLSFNLLQNAIKDVVRANAGYWAKWTLGSRQMEQAQQSLQNAVSAVTGNVPVIVTYPPDANRIAETKFLLASVEQNQNPGAQSWTKTGPALLPMVIDTTNLDALLQGVHCEISAQSRAV